MGGSEGPKWAAVKGQNARTLSFYTFDNFFLPKMKLVADIDGSDLKSEFFLSRTKLILSF
jgi:hypothetical protein